MQVIAASGVLGQDSELFVKKHPPLYSILVIGAGASGLMAACQLAAANHEVTVIEARSEAGGRIRTLPDTFSIPIQTGAEFIHGKQPVTMSLLEAAGCRFSPLSGNWYQMKNSRIREGDFFGDRWSALLDALDKLSHDTDIASFLAEHFRDDKDLRESVRAFVEGYDAADIHRVSAMALRDEWTHSNDNEQYRIQGGYGKLVDYLAGKFEASGGTLLLSSTVDEIQWSAGKAKVLTRSGRMFEGDKVIITVPLGVLQKGLIRFEPPLRQHFPYFQEIGFGGVIKFFIEFKTSFWESRIKNPLRDIAFVFSDAEIPTWWSQRPDSTPLLTGWLGGPSTYDIPDNAEFLYEKALASLRYIFDCTTAELRDEVRCWHIQNWTRDPNTFGAYAFPQLESRGAIAVLTAPVLNTLYFAGEALYIGEAMGTVEAAFVSGRDAASIILKG